MQTRAPDRVIAELAGRQHGVVGRRQLLALGLGREAIAGRLRRGSLHRLHRGVYAVGHAAVSQQGGWMAAVLAAGSGAVLSHRSAAGLWGLLKPRPGAIEVTAGSSTRSHGALRRHCARLRDDEVTLRHGIPVTTVSRTLVDIAGTESSSEFERALREAEVLRLPERPPLSELLLRSPRRRGARSVRAILERLSAAPSGMTRSRLEDRFLRFVGRTRLPAPKTNVLLPVGGTVYEADCLWEPQRLIAELDGNEAHGIRMAFESDRARDRRLQAAGWSVVRVTWHHLDDEAALAADFRKLLDVGPPHESAFVRPGHA